MSIAEIQSGQQLTWLYSPRGGYGYIIPVDAEVVSVKKRVKVRVKKVSGEMVERYVDASSLRQREQ